MEGSFSLARLLMHLSPPFPNRFCRECIRQYLETASEREPECPVCHLPISIDLSQDAIDDEASAKAKQGVLARLDPGKWRTSTKIEALVEELSKLNHEDHS